MWGRKTVTTVSAELATGRASAAVAVADTPWGT
ncbi:hypothetical protein JOD54_006243 [Actinokineospora baliensis]|nr:hypothetical protein [Actinokineospora baliensis]